MYLTPEKKAEMYFKWELNPSESLVISLLLEKFYDEKTRTAYPKQETLTQYLNLSFRTITRTFSALIKKGVLKVYARDCFSKSNRKHVFQKNAYAFPRLYITEKEGKMVVSVHTLKDEKPSNVCQTDIQTTVNFGQTDIDKYVNLSSKGCQSDIYLLKEIRLDTKPVVESDSVFLPSSPTLDASGKEERSLGNSEEPDTHREKQTQGKSQQERTQATESQQVESLSSMAYLGEKREVELNENQDESGKENQTAESKQEKTLPEEKENVSVPPVNEAFIINDQIRADVEYLASFGFPIPKEVSPMAKESIRLMRKMLDDALSGNWRQYPFLYSLPQEAYEKIAQPAVLRQYLEIFSGKLKVKRTFRGGNYDGSVYFSDGREINWNKEYIEDFRLTFHSPFDFQPIQYESIAEFFVLNPEAAPISDRSFWERVRFSYQPSKIENVSATSYSKERQERKWQDGTFRFSQKRKVQQAEAIFARQEVVDFFVETYVSAGMEKKEIPFSISKFENCTGFSGTSLFSSSGIWKAVFSERQKREQAKRAAQEAAEKQEVPELQEATEKPVQSRYEFSERTQTPVSLQEPQPPLIERAESPELAIAI